MAYDWNYEKQNALRQLENAGISPKSEFGVKYLRFSRRINTCWNKMGVTGRAWETMCNSQAYNDASDLLDQFNGQGHRYEEPKYWDQWVALCEANGLSKDAHVGDWLC